MVLRQRSNKNKRNRNVLGKSVGFHGISKGCLEQMKIIFVVWGYENRICNMFTMGFGKISSALLFEKIQIGVVTGWDNTKFGKRRHSGNVETWTFWCLLKPHLVRCPWNPPNHPSLRADNPGTFRPNSSRHFPQFLHIVTPYWPVLLHGPQIYPMVLRRRHSTPPGLLCALPALWVTSPCQWLWW